MSAPVDTLVRLIEHDLAHGAGMCRILLKLNIKGATYLSIKDKLNPELDEKVFVYGARLYILNGKNDGKSAATFTHAWMAESECEILYELFLRYERMRLEEDAILADNRSARLRAHVGKFYQTE